MKLINYKQVKDKKMTSGLLLMSIPLICLCVAMKFIVAMIVTNSLLDDTSLLFFLKDNIGVKGIAQVVGTFSILFSVLFCFCVYNAFVFIDNKYLSKLKFGIIFKIILWFLPLLLIPAVRSDLANFKNENNKQRAKNYIYNNPLAFLTESKVDDDIIGYLVFDEKKEPHAILKKLKEGKNKAKFSTDFLSMNISLDLAIENDTLNISNLSISGKIKHSGSNLNSITKATLPAISSTQIIAQADIPSTTQETSEPAIYKAYIFIYKKPTAKD